MNVRRQEWFLADEGVLTLLGLGTLLGLCWVLLALSTARALETGPDLLSRLLGLAAPIVISVTLVAGALAILYYGLLAESFHIAKWTVFGTGAVIVAVVLNSFWLHYEQFPFGQALFTLVNAGIGGATLGFLVGVYDAQQRRLREDLRAERNHSTRLSQRISVINRVLRHDMRHQTQLVQGHAQRLQNGELDPTTAGERIIHANTRMMDLAEQARKLQELLSGEEYRPRPLDISTVAENACERVEDRHSHLEVDCQLPDGLSIHGTPLLEDVICELLDNAAVHNDGDQAWAKVAVSNGAGTALPVELRVLDDGPGIPEEEPVRGEESESPLHHSDGFGLWFVKWVVEDTGGEVEISSPEEAEVGTEVTLRFPTPS